jgi:proline iminopeptidase
MFASIEPFVSGLLPVGEGNQIFWEASGNPEGIPAIRLHGGPGSGLMSGYRRDFDPSKFMIVGIHQRGCGRSLPLATDAGADLDTNTTPHLIADIEAVREHLGVDRWLVTGVSWGTTLALAYAQAHPGRVTGLVLAAVVTTTASEVCWVSEQMGRVFPREWDEFALEAHARPGQRIIDAYYARITDSDATVRASAASAWCRWEDVHVSLDPKSEPSARFRDADFRLLFATLVIHYWANAGFAGDLLGGIGTISHIPAVLIHGRLDVSSPLRTAWDLHRAWPASQLVILEDEGHGGAAMGEEIRAAIAELGVSR